MHGMMIYAGSSSDKETPQLAARTVAYAPSEDESPTTKGNGNMSKKSALIVIAVQVDVVTGSLWSAQLLPELKSSGGHLKITKL
jgi:hypothetical protein